MGKKKSKKKTAQARQPAQKPQAAPSPPPLPWWAVLLDAHTYPRCIRVAVAVAALAVSILLAWPMVFFILLGVTVLLPLEHRFKRHKQPFLRAQLATDFMHVFVSAVIASIPIILIGAIASNFKVAILAKQVEAQPLWLQGVEAFFFRELIIYWAHRVSHGIPLLWRFHSLHHSSEKLDWLAAQRRHPVDAFYIAACTAIPMALAGFSVANFATLAALSGLWDMTIHANINWRLKWLDGIWVTQEFHHWHHVKDRAVHDNNYAGAFALYDVLFGSYYMPKDRRPGDYGINEPMPDNYLGQLAQPLLPRGSTFRKKT